MAISLDKVKAHLRVVDDSEDDLIQSYLDASVASVFDYLNAEAGDYDPLPIPIEQAVLLRVADFYDNREAVSDRGTYNMNPTMEHLLSPYRKGLGV